MPRSHNLIMTLHLIVVATPSDERREREREREKERDGEGSPAKAMLISVDTFWRAAFLLSRFLTFSQKELTHAPKDTLNMLWPPPVFPSACFFSSRG